MPPAPRFTSLPCPRPRRGAPVKSNAPLTAFIRVRARARERGTGVC
nr:MAG TPA: hypothetical protein [Caudoviricetes sp.]